MQIISHRKLYLPAYIILGVVLIMLVFISVSTYRNFHRQRRNAQEIVQRQGLALIQALAVGARYGGEADRRSAGDLDHLIINFAQIQDIAFLYILDAHGTVIYGTGSRPTPGDSSHPGRPDTRAIWGRIKNSEERLGRKLLVRSVGGIAGGGSQLTEFAVTLINLFDDLNRRVEQQSDALFHAACQGHSRSMERT